MSDTINRQVAIESVTDEIMSVFDTSLNEAYVVAENALGKLPSAESEILACGEGELTAQTDIIHLQKEQEYMRGWEDGRKNLIEQLPSAEPIIHCKDCREFRRYIDTDITFCDLTEAEVKEYDFCSCAVKMMEVEHERD